MRILVGMMLVAMVGGCVPVAFDCDDSGICVWPEPGSEVLEGDVVMIRNQSGDDVSCNSSWQIFDPSTFSVDVEQGDTGQVELNEPRDVQSLEPDSPFRGVVSFYCWEFDGSPGDEFRRWDYSSAI